MQGVEEVGDAWVQFLVFEACLKCIEYFGDFVVSDAETVSEPKARGEDSDGAFQCEAGTFREKVGAGEEDVVGIEDEGGNRTEHERLLVDRKVGGNYC